MTYPKKNTWTRITDTTGRGYGECKGIAGVSQMALGAKSLRGFESLPKPDMKSILTQNAHDLDKNNRFFEDNKAKIAHFE